MLHAGSAGTAAAQGRPAMRPVTHPAMHPATGRHLSAGRPAAAALEETATEIASVTGMPHPGGVDPAGRFTFSLQLCDRTANKQWPSGCDQGRAWDAALGCRLRWQTRGWCQGLPASMHVLSGQTWAAVCGA